MTDQPAPPDAPQGKPSGDGGYRVLARKYRPETFEDLIGQEPMVRTLSNAFSTGRIAQAWILTGVRGVGKTTTARILARALNYETEDGGDGPTMDLSVPGVHCRAIMEGRHIDVIEMDAASHTSINDIREIIDASRYRPSTARYKVYLIDEVHMLSNAAFNGLLKTLEEPPPHVKFVFATTEIRKVPVTILSRCQRFDLRRVEAPLLIAHLEKIAAAEAVEAEPEALRAIARAAEGSVRDCLSLFDQAIAHGAGTVDAETVRGMLGLADHGRIIDLFEAVMKGAAADALQRMRDLHEIGADPVSVLTSMAEFTHFVTRLKHVPAAADDPAVTEEEHTRGGAFAEGLSVRVLSQCWQMLLSGIAEVRSSPRPAASADMVLVRLCYAADLPTPDEVLRSLKDGSGAMAASGAPPASSARAHSGSARSDSPPRAARRGGAEGAPVLAAREAEPVARPMPAEEAEELDGAVLRSLADVADLAGERRDLKLKFDLERYARPIVFEPGRIEIAIDPDGPADLAGNLGRRLGEWTGRRWIVAVGRAADAPTLHEAATAREAALMAEVRADPLVAKALDAFPGARIVDVTDDGVDEDR